MRCYRRWRPFSVLLASVTALSLVSTVVADERTERIKNLAQERLDRSETRSPYACDDGWVADSTGYITDLTQWAETSGLRRGDRIQSIGDVPVSDVGNWQMALSRLTAPGGSLKITVERGSRLVKLDVPCRDHKPIWRIDRDIFEAMAVGRWEHCIDASRRLLQIVNRPWSIYLTTQLECWSEKLKRDKLTAPEDFWRLYYGAATARLEAARYIPGGIARVRPTIVNAIDVLAKRGYTIQSDDLRQQLAAATANTTAPAPAVETPATVAQRQGTAFAVRPDGLLLTAYHVVQNATDIEVTCAGREPMRAVVVKKSPTTDLAVLRVAAPLRAYLALSDQAGPQLGARVFTVGFPASDILGSDAKYTEGVINGLSGPGGDGSYLQTSVQVHPGNSGGPLLDEKGDVIGIIIATASLSEFLKETGSLPQNVNWAVRGALARPLFDVPVPPARVSNRDATISRAIEATCLVSGSAAAEERK
jgi:S1-C subfamily serine protease